LIAAAQRRFSDKRLSLPDAYQPAAKFLDALAIIAIIEHAIVADSVVSMRRVAIGFAASLLRYRHLIDAS